MRSKVFYIISFLLCLMLAIGVKVIRHNYFGFNELQDIVLGSAPSFLYLFGLISLVPLVTNKIDINSFKKTAMLLSLGALVYELEQAWTSRVLDFYDVAATVLAYIVMIALHNKRRFIG